ncbi:MAG: 50S ribosomal protein L24 [Patescibacteria group bacterium]|jgi:large subunit ribosomal protein L24
MKLRKGDKVLVIKGKDRGKSSAIVVVDPKTAKLKLEGLNVYKRHLRKASRPGVAGGITERILPIDAAKVMLICANCNQPTRVGYKKIGGKTERICKKCQAIIAYAKK